MVLDCGRSQRALQANSDVLRGSAGGNGVAPHTPTQGADTAGRFERASGLDTREHREQFRGRDGGNRARTNIGQHELFDALTVALDRARIELQPVEPFT